jgi:hypothetical protein
MLPLDTVFYTNLAPRLKPDAEYEKIKPPTLLAAGRNGKCANVHRHLQPWQHQRPKQFYYSNTYFMSGYIGYQ